MGAEDRVCETEKPSETERDRAREREREKKKSFQELFRSCF